MNHMTLYPLRFEPIYQYRLWGGRRLANLLSAPLPGAGPIGEAWLLSDRDDHPSVVADGPLKGRTIGELMQQWSEQLLGKLAGRFRRFPLLLKFLDARETLSVQVHPSDHQIASTFITEWPTTASAWRDSTCRNACRRN
jgi:mannose-6-phosphate isomerase